MQRATWTDERLDDLAQGIDRRFDQVDRRFEEIDRRFEQVDRRFEQVDRRLDRIDDSIRHLTTTLMLTGGGVLAAIAGGIATGTIGG